MFAHIALVHDISNVWTKLAESNLSQHSQQLDSDIALQLNMFRHSAHSCQNTVLLGARTSCSREVFLLRAAAFLLLNFSAKQWLQRLLRAFSLAQQRCREMLWSYKRIERYDSATPITAPSTIFLDPSAAAYSWSPRFSNSDRKDRQLNPKRKAAVLIAW